MDQELAYLIEDVQLQQGESDEESEWASDPHWHKLVLVGHPRERPIPWGLAGPGSRVKIYWDPESFGWTPEYQEDTEKSDEEIQEEYTDEGYILILPGADPGDIFMSGIVHIPRPGEFMEGKGGDSPPEWIVLGKLVTFTHVVRIEVWPWVMPAPFRLQVELTAEQRQELMEKIKES